MKVTDCFRGEEFQEFCQRSDFHAWLAFLINWGIIAFSFAIVAVWPNPLSVLLAIVLLGGRQLGLGVLMHESGRC